MEEWRDVIGYEGHYQVSDMGRVKSLARTKPNPLCGIQPVNERILKLARHNTGYLLAHLSKAPQKKMHLVHRLVAAAFIGPIPSRYHINHRNSDRTDNRAINLEIVTAQQNVTHSCALGFRDNRGERNVKAKLKPHEVLAIRARMLGGDSRIAIAHEFSVQKSCIDKIATRRSWRHL